MISKSWEPFGIDEWRAENAKIDSMTVEVALAFLSCELVDGARTRLQILNHLEALVFEMHGEERPGAKIQKADLNLLSARLAKAAETLTSLDYPTRQILARASEAYDAYPLQTYGPFNDGSMKVERGIEALADMTAWCRRAIALVPRQRGGRPVKAAVLSCVVGLAQVYHAIAGRPATRNIPTYADDTTENGRFRTFVNIMLKPLGVAVSEHTVKQAIELLRRMEKTG